MTDLELQAEGLIVLPLRLETITVKGGDVDQSSWLNQKNFNNQIGGTCLESDCNQFNFQSNWAEVDQDVDYELEVENVIADKRQIFQLFGF